MADHSTPTTTLRAQGDVLLEPAVGAMAMSVEFHAGLGDLVPAMEAALDQVVAAVPGAVVVPAVANRLRRIVVLPGGAELHLVLGRPVRRRAHGRGAALLMGMAHKPARSDEAVVQAALGALQRIPLTSLELVVLREQMPIRRACRHYWRPKP